MENKKNIEICHKSLNVQGVVDARREILNTSGLKDARAKLVVQANSNNNGNNDNN